MTEPTDNTPGTPPTSPPVTPAPQPTSELPSRPMTPPAQPQDNLFVQPTSFDPNSDVAAKFETWLDEQAAAKRHPSEIEDAILRAGHPEHVAQRAVRAYRRRFPQHPVGWAFLFWSVGIFAVALAGIMHSLIEGSRGGAADWFPLAFVAFPFMIGSFIWAAPKTKDSVQAYSEPRRKWSTVLFWATVGVAVLRGIEFGVDLGKLLFEDPNDSYYNYQAVSWGETFAQLALTIVIAGPIAWWSWYVHREPTVAPKRNG